MFSIKHIGIYALHFELLNPWRRLQFKIFTKPNVPLYTQRYTDIADERRNTYYIDNTLNMTIQSLQLCKKHNGQYNVEAYSKAIHLTPWVLA